MSKIIEVELDGKMQQFQLSDEDFSIDPSALDEALCNCGRLILQYGELEAQLRLEVARRDTDLEALQAALDLEIRKTAVEKQEKLTEGKIKSLIVVRSDYQEAANKLANSQRNYNLMRWVMSALNARKDALIAMAYRERQLMKAEGL